MPVVMDRCLQAMVKNALEPAWEAKFEGTSYGFRPGRSCHDAIEKIYVLARPNKTRASCGDWVRVNEAITISFLPDKAS